MNKDSGTGAIVTEAVGGDAVRRGSDRREWSRFRARRREFYQGKRLAGGGKHHVGAPGTTGERDQKGCVEGRSGKGVAFG